MIETIFDKENEQLSILFNSKNILQNISYKLENDRNSIYFFENLISNIENYDNLPRMQKYYFDNDFKAMYKTLKMFYRGFQSDIRFKKMDASDMLKCCKAFPDHIGERIIGLISYIPIMDLFYEKLKYVEFINKKSSSVENMKKYQSEKLFSDGLLSKTFPNDDSFIDYKLKNEYLSKLEVEYETTRKEEISTALSIMINMYNGSENIEETKINIGSAYWQRKIDISTDNTSALKKVIEGMSKAMRKSNDEKLDKLLFILKNEFEDITNVKIDNIFISKKKDTNRTYFISINSTKEYSKENISAMLKVFVLKNDYECTNLTLDSNFENKNIIFTCSIEL